MRFRRHATPARDDAEGAHVRAPDDQRAPETPLRRPLRDILIIALVGVVGFLVAWMVLAPASIWQDEGTIPRVIGMGLTEARTELTTQGYRVTVANGDAHISAPRGEVYWQDPPPGTTAPPGTSVTVTASTGLLQVPTPDVVGLDQVLAEKVIVASGLKVGARDSVTDRTEVGGVVLGTRPSAGMARSVGASVDLIVNGAAR